MDPGSFDGHMFCFTGFRDQKLVNFIKKYGGNYKDHWVNAVTVLLVADENTLYTNKAKKARARGVQVLTKAEFLNHPFSLKSDVIELDNPEFLKSHGIDLGVPSPFGIRLDFEAVASMDEVPIGISRFGGYPDLGVVNWPRADNVSLQFICQIRLQDVTPLDIDRVLPNSGWFVFFKSTDYFGEGVEHLEIDRRGKKTGSPVRIVYIPPMQPLSRKLPPKDVQTLPCFRLKASPYNPEDETKPKPILRLLGLPDDPKSIETAHEWIEKLSSSETKPRPPRKKKKSAIVEVPGKMEELAALSSAYGLRLLLQFRDSNKLWSLIVRDDAKKVLNDQGEYFLTLGIDRAQPLELKAISTSQQVEAIQVVEAVVPSNGEPSGLDTVSEGVNLQKSNAVETTTVSFISPTPEAVVAAEPATVSVPHEEQQVNEPVVKKQATKGKKKRRRY
jgi:Domain of unknown function (DUF1963)/twin BRCT domain